MGNDIKKYVKKHNKYEYSHVIICRNPNDFVCYPVYVSYGEDIDEIINNINPKDIIYVFNYNLDIDKQFEEKRAYNIEPILDRSGVRSIQDIALEFAGRVHQGQFRNNGLPYINHPIRVAKNVEEYIDCDEEEKEILIVSALLHDVIEDCNVTYHNVKTLFGPSVAGIVLELTNDETLKKSLGKKVYLELKMNNMSDEALDVKLCDRLDNVSDLVFCGEGFKNKYLNETIGILLYLFDNRVFNNNQIKIIEKIVSYLEVLVDDKDPRCYPINKIKRNLNIYKDDNASLQKKRLVS